MYAVHHCAYHSLSNQSLQEEEEEDEEEAPEFVAEDEIEVRYIHP